MGEPASDRMTVRCPCGAKLKVPRTAAGHRAKCPKCDQVFVVPTPKAAGAKPSAPVQHGGADMPLEELASRPRSGEEGRTVPVAGEPRATAGATCPGCGVVLPPGAGLCVMCGYNVAAGQAFQGAGGKRFSRGGRLVKAAGPLLLGTFLSGVGALIGAVVWIAVVAITSYELGLIAWGVGVLA
ncbi:MAG TPA: hypothetical protein VM243_09750, partial [Phycisphaerae bacterium]|nr:hypothetical protein [Phycisphaerae bacterium]